MLEARDRLSLADGALSYWEDFAGAATLSDAEAAFRLVPFNAFPGLSVWFSRRRGLAPL